MTAMQISEYISTASNDMLVEISKEDIQVNILEKISVFFKKRRTNDGYISGKLNF